MDLDRMAAVIRPRRPLEAVDLGFSMVRAWGWDVYRTWFPALIPLWLGITLLCSSLPWLGLLLLWWLKPLYDRLVLQVVSRRLFGAEAGPRSILGTPGKLLGPGTLASLTYLRPDPARSYVLPLGQLEGLKGRRRRRRASLLNQDYRGSAVLLTLTCLLLELAVYFAVAGLIALVLPHKSFGNVLDYLANPWDPAQPHTFAWPLLSLVYLITVSVIEPFYVAGGFSLYLSRRTHLEGWDVELGLRRLSRRLRDGARSTAAALLVSALLLGSWAASPAGAQEVAPEAEPAAVDAGWVDAMGLEKALERVYAAEELQTEEEVTRWVWTRKPKEADDDPLVPSVDLDPMFSFLRALAWIAGGLAAVALVILSVRALRIGSRRRPEARRPSSLPATRSGLLDGESLPDDIPAAARRLIAGGDPLAAVGLLFRGAVAALVERHGAPIRRGWTERDLVRFLKGRGDAERGRYFRRLVAAWQRGAYGHLPPDTDDADELCRNWAAHFSGPRASGEAG